MHCKLNHKNHRWIVLYTSVYVNKFNVRVQYIYRHLLPNFQFSTFHHREIVIGKNHDVIDLTKLISVKTVCDNPETQGTVPCGLCIHPTFLSNISSFFSNLYSMMLFNYPFPLLVLFPNPTFYPLLPAHHLPALYSCSMFCTSPGFSLYPLKFAHSFAHLSHPTIYHSLLSATHRPFHLPALSTCPFLLLNPHSSPNSISLYQPAFPFLPMTPPVTLLPLKLTRRWRSFIEQV